MNEVLQAIKERRSIRAFTGQKISREKLELIMEAARYAPSAKNRQLTRFTVIQKQELIIKLYQAIALELGRGGEYDFLGADVMILASNEKDNPHAVEDCACALENIFLAAYSLGIGSVWINQLKGICDAPRIRAVLRELKVPDSHLVWGMAALGYPAEKPVREKRTDNVEWIL